METKIVYNKNGSVTIEKQEIRKFALTPVQISALRTEILKKIDELQKRLTELDQCDSVIKAGIVASIK